MYGLIDTFSYAVQVYFVAVVVFGSLFILNFLVAVIAVNYSVQREIKDEEEEFLKDNSRVDLVIMRREKLEQRKEFDKFGVGG